MTGLKIKKFLFNIYIHLPWNRYLFILLKKIYLPPYKLRKYLRFTGKFTMTLDNIHLSMLNFGNTIENELFWRGAIGWEGRATKIWKALSEQSTTIFDIGANTGLYSLISALANPSAAVYAFEPVD